MKIYFSLDRKTTFQNLPILNVDCLLRTSNLQLKNMNGNTFFIWLGEGMNSLAQ